MEKDRFNDLIEQVTNNSFDLTEDQKVRLVHAAITGEEFPTYSEHERLREFIRDHDKLSL